MVMTASYEARRSGVRSAMPMSRALRLCPDAIRVPPRFDRYGEISGQVMEVFRSVTPLVEPLSLDEAFLDVTDQLELYGRAEQLARNLKDEIKERTGITLSIGIGSNKTVAKIASDMQKPDGLVVVPPGEEASFLEPLPVRSLRGIGPKAEAILARAGIRTVGQLAHADDATVDRLLGSRARQFQVMAQGNDDLPVETERKLKSVGAETTFPSDLANGPELRQALQDMAAHVSRRLQRKGIKAGTIALKLRYADFRTISRQQSVPNALDQKEAIADVVSRLLDKVAKPEDQFRLLGIQGSSLVSQEESQLGLWREEG